jgi:carbon monoxide dehydrogenase subunit G
MDGHASATVSVSVERELRGVPPETAWRAVADPGTAERAVPGCESVGPEVGAADPDGPGDAAGATASPGQTYVLVFEAPVAGYARSYQVDVTVVECDYPRMRAVGEGVSDGGEFDVEAAVSLSPSPSGTLVSWEGTATVEGTVAAVGSAALRTAARRVVDRYLANVEGLTADAAVDATGAD